MLIRSVYLAYVNVYKDRYEHGTIVSDRIIYRDTCGIYRRHWSAFRKNIPRRRTALRYTSENYRYPQNSVESVNK